MAKKGYYVIVYDQRGQGRSAETQVENYNYDKYADDIKDIINAYKVNDVTLIGHSHGGPISIHAHKKYPEFIKKVVLVGAPVNWHSVTESVFEKCRNHYNATNNNEYLKSLCVFLSN